MGHSLMTSHMGGDRVSNCKTQCNGSLLYDGEHRQFGSNLHDAIMLQVHSNKEFIYWKYSSVHLCFPDWYSSPPPRFQLTTHSPSLRKAHHNNPRPLFSNCMQSYVTSVHRWWTSFRTTSNCILLSLSKVYWICPTNRNRELKWKLGPKSKLQ